MTDTCYSSGKKIILVPSRKENGSWVCHFAIPELKESAVTKYQGHLQGEYKTELEAKMAAFKYSKNILRTSQ